MVHERLKFVVKQAKITQKEIAKIAGCAPNTIFYYTSGRRKPTYFVIQKIAELCEVNLEWLTTGKIIPAPVTYSFQQLHDSTALSTKEFAAKLDKPESFIAAIENGDIWPSDDFLKKALDVFSKDEDFYLPQNVLDKFKRRAEKFKELYPDVIDWMHDKDEKEFRADFDSLVSRQRRIKSLESKQKHP